MLTNMHHPPAEGNFHDGHGNAFKQTHGVCGQEWLHDKHMLHQQMDW